MEINIQNELLTMGAQHGRTGQKLDLKGIVIHYTGNPGSTAIANRNWFENGAGGAGTSVHYIVGLKGEILRLIPDNERAQHAGKSYGPAWDTMAKTNNTYYLGIEVCHPDSSGKFSAITQDALVWLAAWLMKQYGLCIYQIYRHYDVSGKLCPLYYIDNQSAWTKLKNDIQKAYQSLSAPAFDRLHALGIINSPEYWKQNAVEGGLCKGEFAKIFAENVVQYIDAKL